MSSLSSQTSLWERVDSCMSVQPGRSQPSTMLTMLGTSIVVTDVGASDVLRGSSNVSNGAQLNMFRTVKGEEQQLVGVTPRSVGGYRDSLLGTLQIFPTIWCRRVHT